MSHNELAAPRVVAVLLADGWHRVVSSSFSIGPLGVGASADLGVPGFRFEEADDGRPYQPTVLAGRWTASSRSGRSPRPRGASATWTGPGPPVMAIRPMKYNDARYPRAAR